MSISRRHFVAGAAIAPIALKFVTVPAAAKAPMPTSQVMPVQQIQVGDFVVTAVSDGYLDLDPSLLTNIDAEQAKAILEDAFQGAPPVTTGVNAYVVHTGERTVLVDTGGAGFQPNMGNLQERLKAAGISPEEIDDVCLTHLHPDHVGGLVIDGTLAFPNATVHVHQTEFDFWTSTENRDAAPDGFKGFFDGARNAMETAGDKVKTFTGDGEIVAGITSRELFGHTPGHVGYTIESGGNSLLIWGDIVHAAPIQFRKPGVGIAFDNAPEEAIATREALFKDVAASGTQIAGMHVSFPSVGHLVAGSGEGEAYRFIPSDWDYVIGSSAG